jgi:exopolysaccharide biosynthesis protein
MRLTCRSRQMLSAAVAVAPARCAGLICLAAAATAQATTTVTHPFRGVVHYERDEPAGAVVARKVVMHILEIDTTDPTLGIVLTPSNGADPGEVNGQTTREFVTSQSAQIGINGCLWSDVSTGPNGEHYRTVNGIEVAAGQQVSPWEPGFALPGGINFSSTNVPKLVRPSSSNSNNYVAIDTAPPNGSITPYNLIGGRERLITNGTITAASTALNPYTAIGYKGTTLFLFIVDGRQIGYSEGMTLVEIANFMKGQYGLTDLVSLDGGGSTTMVFADPTPRVLNSPSDGSERSVANNFGMFATQMKEWKVNSNGTWSTTGSWTGGVPNAPGAAARFGSAIGSARTVTLTSNNTAGLLEFDNTNSYTIGGASTLTLDATAGPAVVRALAGTHTLAAPLAIIDTTEFDAAAGTTLNVTSSISNASGKIIRMQGDGLVVLSGSQNHGAGAQVNVNAGTLRIMTDLGGSSPVALKLNAGITDIRSQQHLLDVTMLGTSLATVQAGGGNTFRANTLSIAAGAELDLNDNDLVVTSGSFSTIQGLVLAGYAAGIDSTKKGITSTSGQASGGVTILALFNNALAGMAQWPPGSGQTISATAIVGKYTYLGDTNMDGQVTPQDYTAVDSNLGSNNIDRGIAWFYGDTNFDGNVTPQDYSGIDAALGLGAGNPLAAGAVPEPGTIAALGLGMLLIRQRRKGNAHAMQRATKKDCRGGTRGMRAGDGAGG